MHSSTRKPDRLMEDCTTTPLVVVCRGRASMAIEAFGKTDRGCVRNENEDRILVDDSLGLYLVCDGMGGSKRGDVAAELAADAVRYYIGASRDRYDVSWPFGYTFELSLDANRLATGV